MPAPMIVPGPRVFALHKFWLSHQDEREPISAEDRQQIKNAGTFEPIIRNF
jgi:hypothetical protein